MKSNYHSHVALCGHAIGETEDYVKQAIEDGYKTLGMSDHGPIPKYTMSPEDYKMNWLDRQMTYETFIDVYLPDVNNAKEKYKEQINVYTGLEIEYLEAYHDYFAEIRTHLDYMNLATHFFAYENKIHNSFEGATYQNIIGYALNSIKAFETGLYDIMVHPDVFMHKYKNKDGKNEWDEECDKVAVMIIEAAIKHNIYLEINCGGIYKVTAADAVVGEYGYPRRQFWEIASKYKELKVVIGVDAHDPKQLHAKEIKEAKELAKTLGIKVDEFCYTIEDRMKKRL
ncbi:MAG: PHP domain-containing protein [bacterium]